MTRMEYSRIVIRCVGSDLRELVASVIEETTHIVDAVQIIKEELLDGPSMTDDDDDSLYEESLDYTSSEETEDDDDNDCTHHTAASTGEREAAPLSSHSAHITVTIVQASTSQKNASPLLSLVDQELRRRLANPQTYLEPLPKVDEVVYSVPLHMANQDDCNDLELIVLDDDDTQQRMQQDLRSFVQDFDIYKHTEEIAYLLQKNGTLERLFHNLVPLEVSYTNFWERYFFRCCRNRIERELILQHNDDSTTSALNNDAHCEAFVDAAATPSSHNKSVMKMRYNLS